MIVFVFCFVKMATAADDGFEAMGKCPVCMTSLTDPHTLQCLHFCCKLCVPRLEQEVCDDVTGYVCVLCRKFTAESAVRPITFVKGILEHSNVADQMERLCDTCNNEAAKWRCHDCKEEYCDVCRRYHDRFSLFRNHNTVALSAVVTPAADKNVFCDVHPEEMIKLHCKDCRKLICLLCNGTAHKNHRAETVDDAINDVKPRVMRMRNKCEDLLGTCYQVLQSAHGHAQSLTQQYKDIEGCIDQKFDDVIARVRKDCAELIRELNESRVSQIREINKHIVVLNEDIEKRKTVLETFDKVLSDRQGVYLLHGLQNDLLPTLRELSKEIKALNFEGINIKFLETPPGGNTLGSIVPARDESCSILKTNFSEITEKQAIKLIKNIQFEFESIRFVKVGNELWFLEDGTNIVNVYTADTQVTWKRVIRPENTGDLRGAALCNRNVLFAAQRGIFSVGFTEINFRIIIPGDFCDVSVYENSVIALDNSCGKILVLKCDGSKTDLSVINEIPVYGYEPHVWNSVLATQNYIILCLGPSHAILKFKKTGQLIQSLSPVSIGNLQFPMLCAIDIHENILIADRNNHRFVSASPENEWTVCELPDTNEYPSKLLIIEDIVFVNCWFKAFQVFEICETVINAVTHM